jgi:hypothetical protein
VGGDEVVAPARAIHEGLAEMLSRLLMIMMNVVAVVAVRVVGSMHMS